MGVIAIFDFDKTLIRADSFRLFSYIASEKLYKKAVVFLLSLLCKANLLNNKKYKELILRMFWQNKSESKKEKIIQKLYSKLSQYENEKVINPLENHLKRYHKVIVLSASPIFYLKSYIERWSEKIEVYGTKVRVQNGKLRVTNLHGEEKLVRAKSIISKDKLDHIWVYTDNLSDLPVIKLADHVCLVNPSTKLKNELAKLEINYEVII
jgi:HAD superfamily phosphoserine phosphatase-like hydrolase